MRQLMVAKAAVEDQSRFARAAVTRALSATRNLHDVPERAQAWENLNKLSELGILGADAVKLWVQRLEEEHVAANIVKGEDAKRSRMLEDQVAALMGMEQPQQLLIELDLYFSNSCARRCIYRLRCLESASRQWLRRIGSRLLQ